MKKIALVLGSLVFLASVLSAETVMVKAVSGDVKVQNGNSWNIVKAGAKLDDSAVLRVGANGRVQIVNQTGTMINVASSREDSVKNMFLEVTNPRMFAKLNAIKGKISRTGSANDSAATAVAGVRGADVYAQNKESLKKELYWEE
jgi:hypothetical protein